MSSKRKAPESLTSGSKRPTTITSFFAPKPPNVTVAKKQTTSSSSSSSPAPSKPPAASSSPTPSSTSFDKQAWAETLTLEQRDLLQLELDTLHESWFDALKDELLTPRFLELKRFLKKEKEQGKTIYPPEDDIYSWTRYTPLDTVKVVILGQDPYHGPNQAMGLSFSVRPPTPAPPSLKNIYTGLKNDYPTFTPPPNKGGLLTPWAERGVLMLNACLTVRKTEANSHSKKGWEELTQRAIEAVAKRRENGVVFMAWGLPAGKRVVGIDAEKHLILKAVHPSPLSAHRGFFKCGHFRKANEWLAERYGKSGPIDWSLGGPSVGISDKLEATKEETESPHSKLTPETAEKDNDSDKHDEEEEEQAPPQATAETASDNE